MIADFLPEYYVAFSANPTYTILRSIIVDGHEVAWMRIEGTVNIEGKDKPYAGNELFCECDFKKDVGWMMREDGPCCIGNREKCIPRQTALYLRRLELRCEYLNRFKETTYGDISFLPDHTPQIVRDLIKKVKAGEFIGEDGSGAGFWGGYFYLQTLAGILDLPMGEIWKEVGSLVEQKKISLEGAVVQTYRKPPPPKWGECFKIEENGFVGIASLPAHSKMPQEWKLEVYDPNGTKTKEGTLPLFYSPDFGPDIDDVEQAKQKLLELMTPSESKQSTES